MPKTLKDFKALFFDIDLTLSNSAREISPQTQAALKKLREFDIKFNVCSGRHPATLQERIFPFFPTDSIHITCSGGKIVTGSGETLWEKTVQGEILQKICLKANELGMGFGVPYNEWVYANQIYFDKYKEKHHLKGLIKPIAELPRWETNIITITEVTDELTQFLDKIPEVTYKKGPSSAGTIYVDVFPKGINKAVGVMEWCKMTGIEPAEIIGFGDAENDFEFLQYVGYSVAMGNSDERLKKLANRVIGHTDDNGLALYLEGLMEGKPL